MSAYIRVSESYQVSGIMMDSQVLGKQEQAEPQSNR